MDKRRIELGLSLNEISRQTKIPLESTCRVFVGRATSKKVWPIANFLKMDWPQLHNLELSETDFCLAVRGGSPER
jgi:hypothetical protein